MICPACAHENRPGAKFCEECAAPLKRACASCGSELRPTAKFCDECGTAATAAAPAPRPAAAAADTRKVVTILFGDLVGSTALHERLDAESVRQFMESYYAAMRGAVESSTINHAAAALARDAAAAPDRAIVVAGTIGPTGERIRPDGALDVAAAQRIFAEQAQARAEGGVDVLWLETFTTLAELGAALDAAAETALPVVATLTFDRAGNTLSGDTPDAVAAFFRTRTSRPLAIGANCGTGPEPLVGALRVLRDGDPGVDVFVAKSNCGVPSRVDGRLVYPDSPAVMAQYARNARDAGARIIGGCCGATPAHIRAIATALSGYEPGALECASSDSC